MVPFRLPAFRLTMPTISTPIAPSSSLATLVGLISRPSEDFRALAPSEALTPPSFMAARKNARSFTSPPRALITGATFGMAVVTSSSATTVWFSTAFKKLMASASSSDESLKAFCKEIVVSSAFCCSS